MALIKGVRKILKSDLPDAPDWVTRLLTPINEVFNSVIGALRGKLTFSDNFYCEIRELTFIHDSELEISHSLSSYFGILVIASPQESSSNYAIDGYKTRILGPGLLGVKIYFNGAGTTEGIVKIIILGV